MENKFCFLKGIVDCDSARIQDCNNKQTTICVLEPKQKIQEDSEKEQNFCFLMGMVNCSSSRVQDCNNKRVKSCPQK